MILRHRACGHPAPRRSTLGQPCFPQAIIELGHPAQPTGPTPRRPLADVMATAHG